MPKGSWREFEDPSSDNNPRPLENVAPNSLTPVRIQRTRGGKRGKTVTLIKGLNLNSLDLRNLLKKLKIQCGTGGTIKSDVIELQGDQVQISMETLKKEGFAPKQSGG